MAQHVVDQPQAFTGPEPGIAVPQPPGSDLLRPEVRIEQPHGRVEMCQAGAPFDQLPLKTVDHPGEFGSLVAQRTDDMCLSQRRSPAERINGMDDKRRASTLGRPGGGRSYIRPHIWPHAWSPYEAGRFDEAKANAGPGKHGARAIRPAVCARP